VEGAVARAMLEMSVLPFFCKRAPPAHLPPPSRCARHLPRFASLTGEELYRTISLLIVSQPL
jgi:hypothetical protein